MSRVTWYLRNKATEHVPIDFSSMLSVSEAQLDSEQVVGERGACVHLLSPTMSFVVG